MVSDMGNTSDNLSSQAPNAVNIWLEPQRMVRSAPYNGALSSKDASVAFAISTVSVRCYQSEPYLTSPSVISPHTPSVGNWCRSSMIARTKGKPRRPPFARTENAYLVLSFIADFDTHCYRVPGGSQHPRTRPQAGIEPTSSPLYGVALPRWATAVHIFFQRLKTRPHPRTATAIHRFYMQMDSPCHSYILHFFSIPPASERTSPPGVHHKKKGDRTANAVSQYSYYWLNRHLIPYLCPFCQASLFPVLCILFQYEIIGGVGVRAPGCD